MARRGGDREPARAPRSLEGGGGCGRQDVVLDQLDRELERYAQAKGTDSERDVEGFRREQAAATAKPTDIDPDAAFERGHADAMRRVQSAAAEHPFGEEFERELRKLDTPPHSVVEARRERDAREEREHQERFGTPREEQA